MQPLYNTFTALAVSAIYLAWRTYAQAQVQRVRTLHERVTYMLWTMANQVAC
jgi:hypothetical protein